MSRQPCQSVFGLSQLLRVFTHRLSGFSQSGRSLQLPRSSDPNHAPQQVVLIVWTLAEQFIDTTPPPVSEGACVKNNPSRGGVPKWISDGILFGAGAAA